MSMMITAVPAVASGDSLAPGSTAERALPAFVTNLQNSPTSAMPQLANPAALASELFGSLRGYLERSQNLQRALRSTQSPGADADNVRIALASLPNEQPATLHGGPARESLEANTGGIMSPAARLSLAQLQHVMDLALASMNFATETALVTRGTSQIAHSVNTLLKGQ